MNEDLRLSNLSVTSGQAGKGWPWEKKYEVVTQWLVLGNIRLVSELTKVPDHTIRTWKTQEWWGELVASIKQEQQIKTSSKLSRIIEKSLDAVEDRLENGEMVVDRKTGEILRRPVVLKDAAKAANDLLARQAILEKNSGVSSETNESMQDILANIAKEFKKFNKEVNKTLESQDAIHEKREEGLREGGSPLHE